MHFQYLYKHLLIFFLLLLSLIITYKTCTKVYHTHNAQTPEIINKKLIILVISLKYFQFLMHLINLSSETLV